MTKKGGHALDDAACTGKFRVLDVDVAYPKGLRLKVTNEAILTDAGKKATEAGELAVEVAKREREACEPA